MPEHVRHLLETRTSTDHPRCSRVPQDVRATAAIPEADSLRGISDGVADNARADGFPDRNHVADEERAFGSAWPPVTQVGDQCSGCAGRERQYIVSPRLAPMQEELAGLPIHGVEPQLRDLACPEPEVGNATGHRVIAPPRW